jgi:signal peptidase I
MEDARFTRRPSHHNASGGTESMMSPATAVSPPRLDDSDAGHTRRTIPAQFIAERTRANGSACVRVLGRSMFPWIRPGDFVFVRRHDFGRVAPGDVILFERDSRIFAHRVLRRVTAPIGLKSGPVFITKGDALDGVDAPVSASEFLGRITRIHRRQRHIDLESLGQVFCARLLACISPASSLLYRPLRWAKRLLSFE